MVRAVELAAAVRARTSPNPWVGCVIVTPEGQVFEGATEPPGGRHAEVVALDAAGSAARDATVYVTLEPCAHQGRTPPCADALLSAGVARVVIGVADPDRNVAGRGIARLRDAGVDVQTGVARTEVADQLGPYLKHRRTGRPWVVLKLAASIDGRAAAPDGSSRWITGAASRADAHRLRAESDAVIVGSGTVLADDPELTVRDAVGLDPLRVVLGKASPHAKVHPCIEMSGPLPQVLDELGARGVVQALVEGGPRVAGEFHRQRLVDRYVIYMAPVLFGGDDGRALLAGPGAPSIADVWRGRISRVTRLAEDLKIEIEAEAD